MHKCVIKCIFVNLHIISLQNLLNFARINFEIILDLWKILCYNACIIYFALIPYLSPLRVRSWTSVGVNPVPAKSKGLSFTSISG